MGKFVRFLGWFYFNRVALLFLSLIGVVLPLLRDNSLFGNVIDMSGRNGDDIFRLALMTVLACSTAIATMNLINYYGPDRFDVAKYPTGPIARLGIFATGAAAAISLLSTVALRSEGNQVLWMLLGALAGIALILGVKVIQAWFTDPKLTPKPEFYIFPSDIIPDLSTFLQRLTTYPPPAHGAREWLNNILAWPLRLLAGSGDGYFVGNSLHLRPGHLFAAVFLLVSILVYHYAGGSGFARNVVEPWSSLNYLLLAGTVICWLFAGASFFLDRFRIPLLWPVAAFCVLAGWNTDTDHFYLVREKSAYARFATPGDVLKRISESNDHAIVIAAAGGGIQAAAWTAQVLTELERRNPGLRSRVALISGVSGGAAGTMFYLQNVNKAPKWATESSLENVAWGWLKADVYRIARASSPQRTAQTIAAWLSRRAGRYAPAWRRPCWLIGRVKSRKASGRP
jgi:hypothetical protein